MKLPMPDGDECQIYILNSLFRNSQFQ